VCEGGEWQKIVRREQVVGHGNGLVRGGEEFRTPGLPVSGADDTQPDRASSATRGGIVSAHVADSSRCRHRSLCSGSAPEPNARREGCGEQRGRRRLQSGAAGDPGVCCEGADHRCRRRRAVIALQGGDPADVQHAGSGSRARVRSSITRSVPPARMRGWPAEAESIPTASSRVLTPCSQEVYGVPPGSRAEPRGPVPVECMFEKHPLQGCGELRLAPFLWRCTAHS